MTLEYLNEQKEKYFKKSQYFALIGFDNLSTDFQDVVNFIEEIEKYIKGEEDEKNNEN